MDVKNGEIEGDLYRNLMNYVFQKCDVIRVSVRRNQHEDSYQREMKVLLDNGHSKEEMIENYSEDYLNYMLEKWMDSEVLFDCEYRERWETKDFCDLIRKQNREQSIVSPIQWTIYQDRTKKWLDSHKEDIIYEKKEFFGKMCTRIDYYLKLTPEIRNDILNKKSLYEDWRYPLSVEDIAFFENGYCWLNTVSHESMCWVYFNNETEYKDLLSMGIEFYKDHFIFMTKEKLYYESH